MGYQELHVINESQVKSVSTDEINYAIEEVMRESNSDFLRTAELAVYSASLLTSSEARINEFESQGAGKRLFNELIGKNARLRSAIQRDTLTAQYAGQQMLNAVLRECSRNQYLALSVNERLNRMYRDLSQEQEWLTGEFAIIRKKFVAFYHDYCARMDQIFAQLDQQYRYLAAECRVCHTPMVREQMICPKCGTIHTLKTDKMSEEVISKLQPISKIVKVAQKIDLKSDSVESICARTSYINQLFQHIKGIPKEDSAAIKQELQALEERCQSKEFQVAFVGNVKSGKSTLMNTLLGEELAFSDTLSATAALTRFRLLVSQRGEPDYYVRIERSNQDAQIIPQTSFAEISKTLREWSTGENAKNVSLVEVGINKRKLKCELIDDDCELIFVDTPGLHDTESRRDRSETTEHYLQEADMVFFLQRLGASSENFSNDIKRLFRIFDKNPNRLAIVASCCDLQESEEERKRLIEDWQEEIKKATGIEQYPIIRVSAKTYQTLERMLSKSKDELEEIVSFDSNEATSLDMLNAHIRSIAGRSNVDRYFPVLTLKESADIRTKVQSAFGIPQMISMIQTQLNANELDARKKNDLLESYKTLVQSRGVMMEWVKVQLDRQNALLRQSQWRAEQHEQNLHNAISALKKAEKETDDQTILLDYLEKSLNARLKAINACVTSESFKRQQMWLCRSVEKVEPKWCNYFSYAFSETELRRSIDDVQSEIQGRKKALPEHLRELKVECTKLEKQAEQSANQLHETQLICFPTIEALLCIKELRME